MAKVYDLGEIIAAETEADPGFDVMVGGKTFHIPPITLWPDDAIVMFSRVGMGDFSAVVESARALLGDRYEDFTSAGGSALLLIKAIEKSQGATPGESPASTDS